MTMTRPSWVVRVVCLSERGMVSNSGRAYQREGWLVTVAVPTRVRGVVSDNDKIYLGSKSGVLIRLVH